MALDSRAPFTSSIYNTSAVGNASLKCKNIELILFGAKELGTIA